MSMFCRHHWHGVAVEVTVRSRACLGHKETVFWCCRCRREHVGVPLVGALGEYRDGFSFHVRDARRVSENATP